jgi:hypothetical protein
MLKQPLDKAPEAGGCSSNPLGEADVTDVLVDPGVLRAQVRQKYPAVAFQSAAEFHFHTGRGPAARLGYPTEAVDRLPDAAVESLAGVGNPFGGARGGSNARFYGVSGYPFLARSREGQPHDD